MAGFAAAFRLDSTCEKITKASPGAVENRLNALMASGCGVRTAMGRESAAQAVPISTKRGPGGFPEEDGEGAGAEGLAGGASEEAQRGLSDTCLWSLTLGVFRCLRPLTPISCR